MGSGGHNRKLVSELKKAGTYKASRHKDRLIVSGMDAIPMPPPSFDDDEKREWFNFYGAALKVGIETDLDYQSTVDLIRMERVVSMCYNLWKEDPCTETLKDYLSASAALQKAHQQHGMTPLSRQAIRMQPAPKDEKSAFDKLREKMEKLNGE